jgi:hypothetical protein
VEGEVVPLELRELRGDLDHQMALLSDRLTERERQHPKQVRQ